MALRKKGKYWYGDGQLDICEELQRYSKLNSYPIQHFANAICTCGNRLFFLQMDDTVGAAVRRCASGDEQHPIGDSADYLEDAQLQKNECACGKACSRSRLASHSTKDSVDVRWLYLGCRCPACELTGCYGDWKNEFNGYEELLRRV